MAVVMYYGFIFISVALFGGCFAINDIYGKMRGSHIKVSLQFSLISALGGLAVLLIANGFSLQSTPFTLVMAILCALDSLAFTFCSFKALGRINLSLYSLYSMLGGMLLPFLQGVLLHGESISVAKIVCCILIVWALFITVDKTRQRGGTIYYIGIFILNGMSGVLSKVFTDAPFPKTNASSYAILTALCTALLSLLILVCFYRNIRVTTKETPKSLAFSLSGGIFNRVANLLLVVALTHVDASAQYPLVTGGVMIVSTVICYLRKDKPSNKELLSVLLAFLGMLALFIIPI